MRGRLQSREGPARREWLQLGPSTGSILPFGRRAGSHRAVGTCSSVNDQQCLAAVQALSGPRHGKTRIGSFYPVEVAHLQADRADMERGATGEGATGEGGGGGRIWGIHDGYIDPCREARN